MTGLLKHPTYGYGARSCRLGGNWRHAADERNRAYLTKEMAELRARSISTDEWQMLLAEVASLLDDAMAGELNFDTTYTKGVVCKAASASDVLEARLDLTVNLDGERRLLRLYFSEPDDEDGLLLSLSFRHKRGGPLGLEEQDEHIREAQERFTVWARTRRAV
ncbi:MAG: hypothetical protein Q4E00_08325 [Actinomyces bowdenii]|nr:hypothetical protein [Actinomyces bowdenii]